MLSTSSQAEVNKIHHVLIPCSRMVFGVSSGSLIGNSLVEHPDVRKVGFTGSTPVGKDIMRRYIEDFLKFLLLSCSALMLLSYVVLG